MAWEPQKWPKICGCGRSYTPAAWEKLKLVGIYDDEYENLLELRNCPCKSTIAVKIAPSRNPWMKEAEEKARATSRR